MKPPDETALILDDDDLAASIADGMADASAEDAADVFAELDAEMRDDQSSSIT